MVGTSFRLRRFIVGNTVCRFLLQRQFYVFLAWGVITFLQAVLFALAGEYRYSLLCLFVSALTPGLAPNDSFAEPLKSKNAAIRALATYGSRHYRKCRLLCLLAAILMMVSIIK